jgi:polygalacturonase
MRSEVSCQKRVKIIRAILSLVAGVFSATGIAFATPTLPNINTNNIVTITNSPYNAVGDGSTDNTLAISNAIVQANKGGNTNGLYGGTVRIPGPGIFLTGPLTLKNNVDIQVDGGATLMMLPVSLFTNYPAQNLTYPDLIYAAGVTNLEISGSGTIDGQGLQWWTNSVVSGSRPYMIFFNGNCKRVLVQDVTVQNPPKMHFVFKSSGDANITFQNMTINTTDFRANQCDGIDLVGTNILIQNCTINAGDDNIALGSSSSTAYSANILVTNCAFGTGHGVSIGSNTAGAVSNLTVINCTFNGTQYGIRMKSSDNTSGGSGEGGIAQNLNYLNIGMTNITYGAVVIYSYYDSSAGGNFGTPTSVTPLFASTQAVDVTSVPVWRNITISNVTATVSGSGVPGIIWARMEVPATNIVFNHVNISGPQPFDVYNAGGVQFIDCQITNTGGGDTFELFNALVTVSNSVPTNTLFSFDGLSTNVPGSALNGSTLAFYNAQASMKNTNLFDDGPLTLSASTLTVSNNLTLFPTTTLNYVLGTNATTLAVTGSLTLGGTNNISAGGGFTNRTYTLMTHSGALDGSLPMLGSVPAGYNYSIKTNIAGQVNLVVTLPAPAAPTNLTATATNLLINLKWNSVTGATGYNLKRGTINTGPYPTIFSGLTATNYADANVTNAVNYFYVVSAVAGGESTNSLQVTAVPLPSNQPTNLVLQTSGNQFQLSWPQSHLGWRLQIQTNNLTKGIWTNWATVPNSTNVISTNLVINPANGAVFLRLVYP